MVQSVNVDFLKMNLKGMLMILDLHGKRSASPTYGNLMNLNAMIAPYFPIAKADAGSEGILAPDLLMCHVNLHF
jgi:hypothetical protein